MGCARVMQRNGSPVRLRPSVAVHLGLANALGVLSADLHRDGEPFQALVGLNQVPVTPITPRVLNIVQQDELVDAADKIKIPFPGYVIRLYDGGALSH